MKRKYLFFIFLIVLLFIVICSGLLFLGCQDSNVVAQKNMVYGNGAVINIWIDSYSRLDVLKDHNVKYLFVDVGDTDSDGKIKTPAGEITGFLDFVHAYEKKNGYDFILLAYSEIITDNYNINSPDFKVNFVSDYIRLSSIGFDGVLVDIENIKYQERETYLIILDELNRSMPNSIISAYAGAIGYDTSNSWEWTPDFYSSVSSKVDIISAPAYDSDKTTSDEYISYVKEQVRRINSGNYKSYFLFAVPTHKGSPETIDNSLSAYKESFAGNPKFLGVTVFAEWTAKQDDWKTFEKYLNP
jgi:hypothetical protein